MRIIALLFITMLALSAADAELKLAKDGTATITAKDSDLILYGYGKGLGMGTIVVNGKPQQKPKVDPTKCSPFYSFEYKDGKDWKENALGWCGTGAGQFTLPKGKSATFKVAMDMNKQRPLRLTVSYKKDAKGKSLKVKSNEVK